MADPEECHRAHEHRVCVVDEAFRLHEIARGVPKSSQQHYGVLSTPGARHQRNQRAVQSRLRDVDVPFKEDGKVASIVCPVGGAGQFDRELEIVRNEQTGRHDVREHGEAEHETLDANEQGSPPEPCQQQQLHQRRDGEKVRLERKTDAGEQTDADRNGLAGNLPALQPQHGRGEIRHREENTSVFPLPEAEPGRERSDENECDHPARPRQRARALSSRDNTPINNAVLMRKYAQKTARTADGSSSRFDCTSAADGMNNPHTMGRFPSSRSVPRALPCSNHREKCTK